MHRVHTVADTDSGNLIKIFNRLAILSITPRTDDREGKTLSVCFYCKTLGNVHVLVLCCCTGGYGSCFGGSRFIGLTLHINQIIHPKTNIIIGSLLHPVLLEFALRHQACFILADFVLDGRRVSSTHH